MLDIESKSTVPICTESSVVYVLLSVRVAFEQLCRLRLFAVILFVCSLVGEKDVVIAIV